MINKLIFLAGAKRSGKDTLAKAIQDTYPYVRTFKTNCTLLHAFKEFSNIPQSEFENIKDNISDIFPNFTNRELLINFGEALENKFNSYVPILYGQRVNVFKYLTLPLFKKLVESDENKLIITDLRDLPTLRVYESLAKDLTDNKVEIVKYYIWREEAEKNKGEHWTENFYRDNLDVVKKEFKIIKNNGSFEEYLETVKKFVTEMR